MDDISEFKRLAVLKLNHVLQVHNGSLESKGIPQQFELMIITSFGHIEGEYFEEDNGDLGLGILSNAITMTKHENPPVILLKNAKITPYGHKSPVHLIEQMTIFTDQIVGLSFK